jgi:hypothetical protein
MLVGYMRVSTDSDRQVGVRVAAEQKTGISHSLARCALNRSL